MEALAARSETPRRNASKANESIAFPVTMSRLVSFGTALLTIGVAACDGSTVTIARSPSSTRSSWQVILTVSTSGVSKGISRIV